jgi:DNA polymerase phi
METLALQSMDSDIMDVVDNSLRVRSDAQLINAHRSWIVDQFAALIRNGAIPKDDGWLQQILDWLTVHGIFVVKKRSPNSPICAVITPPPPPPPPPPN